MDRMIGYCGLDCRTCDAYLATIHNDQALREKTAKLWAELNHAPILPEHISCEGCRGDGAKTVYCDSLCAIRQCALRRQMATCGDCPDAGQCGTLAMVTADNAEARKRLNLEGECR